MKNVSVGNIENLEETIKFLKLGNEKVSNASEILMKKIEFIVIECQVEITQSTAMFVEAVAKEAIKGAELAEATTEHAMADAELASAIASGNPIAIATASTHVAETFAKLQSAYEEYERAKNHRIQMEQRKELAERATSAAKELQETVRSECAARRNAIESYVETGVSRLTSARSALDDYITTDTNIADFLSWLNWVPSPNVPVTIAEINRRLNLNDEQIKHFISYLSNRHPEIREKIADYRRQLSGAKGDAERLAVQLKIRKNFSGLISEKIVEYALKPLGESSSTQSRTTFDDGKATKTDVIIYNLKIPVILGRGEGRGVPKGGSIAIEVKCGSSNYIYSQKDHMVFQAGGHKNANTSITICSRDIKDLSPEEEEKLREALREAGSPLIGMLPRKDEIDKACWKAVTQNERGQA